MKPARRQVTSAACTTAYEHLATLRSGRPEGPTSPQPSCGNLPDTTVLGTPQQAKLGLFFFVHGVCTPVKARQKRAARQHTRSRLPTPCWCRGIDAWRCLFSLDLLHFSHSNKSVPTRLHFFAMIRRFCFSVALGPKPTPAAA